MACKYVKDFTFSSSDGYSGSAGQKPVSGYMRGGAVKKAAGGSAKAPDVDTLRADFDSTKRGSDYLYGPVRKDGPQLEVRVGRKPTKLEAMEYVDAERRIRRSGSNVGVPREMAEIGYPAEAEGRRLKAKMPDLATGQKPVKKSLGGIVKTLVSPLAAVASGSAPKGIGALGGIAGSILEEQLRKKRNRAPMAVQDITAVSGPQMRRGGKVGVPVASRKPMYGK